MLPSESVAASIGTLAHEFPLLGRALTAHRNKRGGPISFVNRPYLVEVYTEGRDFDDAVFQKAVQTGISEWMIQLLLDAAGWRGRIGAYVLPTYTVRNRFVQSRINPLLSTVPEYRERCPSGGFSTDGGEHAGGGAARSTALKHFGRDGAIMFLGSETANDFVEFSADILIVDEFNKCNAENVALAGNRIRESPYPQRIYVGNPEAPGHGICREYAQTDCRRWFHRCSRCGERQAIDWFRQIVERDSAGRWVARDRAGARDGHVRPICVRCRRPFERVAEGGLWVAERPSVARRGYKMSRMDILNESLAKLVREWIEAQGNPDLIRSFIRSVTGEGYELEGARLTDSDLQAASTGPALDPIGGEAYGRQVVTCGIDVGAVQNVVVSVVTRDAEGKPIRRAAYIGAVPFSELASILRRFRVQVAVIDIGPETTKAQELRDEMAADGIMVWLCRFYPSPRVGTQKYGMRLDYQTQVVEVDRSGVFDASHDDIVGKRRQFPADVAAVPHWSSQMRAPARTLDAAKGRIVWDEGGVPDHYRLAECYDRVACDLLDQGGQFFTTSGQTAEGSG